MNEYEKIIRAAIRYITEQYNEIGGDDRYILLSILNKVNSLKEGAEKSE